MLFFVGLRRCSVLPLLKLPRVVKRQRTASNPSWVEILAAVRKTKKVPRMKGAQALSLQLCYSTPGFCFILSPVASIVLLLQVSSFRRPCSLNAGIFCRCARALVLIDSDSVPDIWTPAALVCKGNQQLVAFFLSCFHVGEITTQSFR